MSELMHFLRMWFVGFNFIWFHAGQFGCGCCGALCCLRFCCRLLRLRRSLFDYGDYRILQDLGRGKKLEWVKMSLEMEEPSLAMLSLPEQDISGYINWVISSCWFLIYDTHDDLWWSHNEYDFSWFIHDYDDPGWFIWILSHGHCLQVAPWAAAALAQFQPRRWGIFDAGHGHGRHSVRWLGRLHPSQIFWDIWYYLIISYILLRVESIFTSLQFRQILNKNSVQSSNKKRWFGSWPIHLARLLAVDANLAEAPKDPWIFLTF